MGIVEISVLGRELQQGRCESAGIRRESSGIELILGDDFRGIRSGQAQQMSCSINGDSVQRGQVISLVSSSNIVGRGSLHAGGNSWQGLYELDGVRLTHGGRSPVQIGRIDADGGQLRTYAPRLYDGRINPLIPDGVLSGNGQR